MEVDVLSILSWLAGFTVVTFVGFLVWIARNKFTQVDDHESRINRLEVNSVTPEQVRSIVHQSNEPLMQALADMKKDINGNTQTMNMVLQELAEQKGYEKAMKEMRERNDN